MDPIGLPHLPHCPVQHTVFLFVMFTEDAFALFRLLHPRFDLVVVGHGQEATVRDPISPRVIMGKAHTSSCSA